MAFSISWLLIEVRTLKLLYDDDAMKGSEMYIHLNVAMHSFGAFKLEGARCFDTFTWRGMFSDIRSIMLANKASQDR